MTRQLSRREQKKVEIRQRLVDAASNLFRKYGYEQTTIARITRTAEVAKGTFFNYFESKEAILPALVEHRMHEILRETMSECGGPTSPVMRIKHALRLLAASQPRDQAMAERLRAALAHHRDDRPVRAFIQFITNHVKLAQAADEIRADVDASFVAGFICSMFFYQMMLQHHRGHLEAIPMTLDDAIDLLLAGIGGRDWGSSA
ncbi:MAG: TetR/AcrR family transcriptional regulator [Chloroflexi bacterium]|nr:TetR/AcrR family transcriptional regulator [Chloroflexota bacterium]